MKKVSKIGTESNPIRLVQENVLRPKLVDCSSLTLNDQGVYDFGKIKDLVSITLDFFYHNLILNPNLSASDIQVGFLLYDILTWGEGCVFWLVPECEASGDEIGDEGFLITTKPNFDPLIVQSLVNICASYKLNYTQDELINCLNILHDFYYITCTEISDINSAENRINFEYKNKKVNLTKEAKIVHIRLNSGMDKKNITNKWLNKRERKSEL